MPPIPVLLPRSDDSRSWEQPDTVQPKRFHQWNGNPYNFIPQSGGDYHNGHRFPAEWIMIELVKTVVKLLVSAMKYEVPDQNLQIDMSRVLAIPERRFVMSNVRRI